MIDLDLSEAGLTECEAVIQRSMDAFVDAGRALIRIRDQRLYKPRYPTFERYAQKRWGFSRQRSQQLMAAAEVIGIVEGVEAPTIHEEPEPEESSNGYHEVRDPLVREQFLPRDRDRKPTVGLVPPPSNERIARELAPLRNDPQALRGAWQEANGKAAQYGRAPTSTDVRAAVHGRAMGPVARPPATPAPGSEERVGTIVEAWATLANAAREVIAMERTLISDVDLTDPQRWRITEAHKHALGAIDGR